MGKQALWQVFARVLEQGSRLSAVRLVNAHAACDVLELDGFNEDDLYRNLDWLSEEQKDIEDRLFRQRYPTAPGPRPNRCNLDAVELRNRVRFYVPSHN